MDYIGSVYTLIVVYVYIILFILYIGLISLSLVFNPNIYHCVLSYFDGYYFIIDMHWVQYQYIYYIYSLSYTLCIYL